MKVIWHTTRHLTQLKWLVDIQGSLDKYVKAMKKGPEKKAKKKEGYKVA